MDERTTFRLQDIIKAIDQIHRLIGPKSYEELHSDPILWAAFERFLEIVSEASRHIPAEMKSKAPEMEWRRIGDIGNHLRHAYHRVDAEILWRLHADGELQRLRDVAVGIGASG